MPTEEDPRCGGGVRPDQDEAHQELDRVATVVGADPAAAGKETAEGGVREAEEEGDEENAGGMATREGPVIDGEGEANALVVDGVRAAREVLDEADEDEVEKGAE
ncbi:hypothetical protein COCNU_scaffold180110G000010 [Cocos nucifera]|nr:hypothetical protein [Cocos nucifera]